jgi:drug/metabolite transporter (DMT)-like permease
MGKWISYWIVTLIFGSGFLLINIASKQVTALELTVMRTCIAAGVLYVLMRANGLSLPQDYRSKRALFILGIINYTIPFTLLAWAQQQGVNSGLSGVLIAMNPLFTASLAHFAFNDERMTTIRFIGVVLGLIGVGILASKELSSDAVNTAFVGQMAVILAALSFASSNIYSRFIMGDERITPIIVGAGSNIGSAIVTLALWGLVVVMGGGVTAPSSIQTDGWIAILILALVHSVVPSVLTKVVIRALGATVLSTTQYLVPIIALVLGAIFLDETIDTRVLIGTVVILSGVAFANFGEHAIRAVLRPARSAE